MVKPLYEMLRVGENLLENTISSIRTYQLSVVIRRDWEVSSGAQKWGLSLRIIIEAIGHGYTGREYRLVREEEKGQKLRSGRIERVAKEVHRETFSKSKEN